MMGEWARGFKGECSLLRTDWWVMFGYQQIHGDPQDGAFAARCLEADPYDGHERTVGGGLGQWPKIGQTATCRKCTMLAVPVYKMTRTMTSWRKTRASTIPHQNTTGLRGRDITTLQHVAKSATVAISPWWSCLNLADRFEVLPQIDPQNSWKPPKRNLNQN